MQVGLQVLRAVVAYALGDSYSFYGIQYATIRFLEHSVSHVLGCAYGV